MAGAVGSRQTGFAVMASGREDASLDGDDDYAGLGSENGGRGMWGKLLGGGAMRADDPGAAPYDASFYGLVFGADVYRSARSWWASPPAGSALRLPARTI